MKMFKITMKSGEVIKIKADRRESQKDGGWEAFFRDDEQFLTICMKYVEKDIEEIQTQTMPPITFRFGAR